MSRIPVLLVTMKGLDNKGQKSIISALNLLKSEGINYQLNLGALTNAHLLIVDINEECGQQALEQAVHHQVKLVLTNKHENGENFITLPMPFSDSILKHVLTRIFFTMIGHIERDLCRKIA